ncbi:MerR family transcriptional regulator [Streptomyces sp. NPDC012637]|uniref:MerR family transcriptional regulator n=1 Tax=Streptomyces sp. NPDC012637 TaxID=3364842 RepID=UPI0036E6492E
MSTKTIRVYHDKGLLAEPDRDASGYRRYRATDAIELIKIRALAEAGVPLARITSERRQMRTSSRRCVRSTTSSPPASVACGRTRCACDGLRRGNCRPCPPRSSPFWSG